MIDIKSPTRFKAGQWVSFNYGATNVLARLIEDLGPLGIGGRHIFRVRLHQNNVEPMTFDVSETDLAEADILAYLKNGGLVEMLRSNVGGTPPSVWLTLDSNGDIVHTFLPGQGLIGGQCAPFFALHDGKIFDPKVGEVIKFLQDNFALTQQEARDIVRAVGTSM